jgi:hypothetical protein
MFFRSLKLEMSFFRHGGYRFLAADGRQLVQCNVYQFFIVHRTVYATVQGNFFQLRHLHDAFVAERFINAESLRLYISVSDVVLWIVLLLPLLDTSPDFLETRTFLSSLFTLHFEGCLPSHNITLEIWIGASCFTIPPLVFVPKAWVCFVIMLAPSTITFPLPPVLLYQARLFQVSVITGNYHHGVSFLILYLV